MRYRNTATAQVIAMLVKGAEQAALLLEADIATLGFMVIVDPEYETFWQARMREKRAMHAHLSAMIELVRAATLKAKEELNPEQGNG